MNHYTNPTALNVSGYEVHYTRYADSILNAQFLDAKKELETVLDKFYVEESQIIDGGGGKSDIAQALEDLLKDERWIKRSFKTELYLEGERKAVETIKVDHYKFFRKDGIALKIQWNSKDSVFYNNLEVFRKLHNAGGLALGIMITRGKTLQDELSNVYRRFLDKQRPLSVSNLRGPLSLSQRDQREFDKLILEQKDGAINAIATSAANSKFGAATTHMDKLIEKIEARAGDPCPLIIIGIGKDRLLQ
jgi:Restriction endonuclease BglII